MAYSHSVHEELPARDNDSSSASARAETHGPVAEHIDSHEYTSRDLRTSRAMAFYEAGAIAGLGVIRSLRRLQKKWETAREYWQSEVREEGRKALRASEASMQHVLDQGNKSPAEQGERMQQLSQARGLVQKAEEALDQLK